MNPVQQYVRMVLFTLSIFQNEIWDSYCILILGTLGSERVKTSPSGDMYRCCMEVVMVVTNSKVDSAGTKDRSQVTGQRSQQLANMLQM